MGGFFFYLCKKEKHGDETEREVKSACYKWLKKENSVAEEMFFETEVNGELFVVFLFLCCTASKTNTVFLSVCGQRCLLWRGSWLSDPEGILQKENAVEELEKERGPFSYVLFDAGCGSVFYGRDSIGRLSLLVSSPSSRRPGLAVSSASCGMGGWEECSGNQSIEHDIKSGKETPRAVRSWEIEKAIEPKDVISMTALKIEKILRRIIPKDIDEIGVLFSGGLDSMVLAHFLCRCVPEDVAVFLVNVSFMFEGSYETPDRVNAIAGQKELEAVSKRKTFFVPVDVSLEEYREARMHVQAVIQPSDTQMDASIGLPVWFACGGVLGTDASGRVPALLVSGTGPDELLGGYSRHRTVFRHGGELGLEKELRRELAEIGRRSLGRDDRCASDCGREMLHPYLDEEFVSWVLSLPLSARCDLTKERGVGDKHLLRGVAKAAGLDSAAGRVKRAIQFGSRSAKMAEKKE
ncbi:MAG: asparagine synthase [Amphiamblys sp. WSBS2006]|nr:MAG: asparagine synthase [Amphiamblys sp. WSBS2006]